MPVAGQLREPLQASEPARTVKLKVELSGVRLEPGEAPDLAGGGGAERTSVPSHDVLTDQEGPSGAEAPPIEAADEATRAEDPQPARSSPEELTPAPDQGAPANRSEAHAAETSPSGDPEAELTDPRPDDLVDEGEPIAAAVELPVAAAPVAAETARAEPVSWSADVVPPYASAHDLPTEADAGDRSAKVAQLRDPLDLGSDRDDPLIAELVARNETTVRLNNAIAIAAGRGELPITRLSEYFALGEEGPELLKRRVLNLGRKSVEELDLLLRLARAEASQARTEPPEPPAPADDVDDNDLRARLACAISLEAVEDALAEHDTPVRLWNALRNQGLLLRPLREFVLSYPDLEPQLARLPNLGRTSLVAARSILGQIVRGAFEALGFSRAAAEDAAAVILDAWEPDPPSRARLLEALPLVPGHALSRRPTWSLRRDQLRRGLAAFFQGRAALDAIAGYGPPARLPHGLERVGYARKPLSELLLNFRRLEAELLRLPNLGRKSYRAAEEILHRIVGDELGRLGFSREEARDAGLLLVENAALSPAASAALVSRLFELTGLDVRTDTADEPEPQEPPPALPPAAQPAEVLLPELLASLEPRERDVLERRYGVAGPRQTLEEVGQAYAVTRERARQIEKKALRRLRDRAQRRLKAAVLEKGRSAWDALAGEEPGLLTWEVSPSDPRISPYFHIAVDALGWSLRDWLDHFAVAHDRVWMIDPDEAQRHSEVCAALQSVLNTRELPCYIGDLLPDVPTPEARFAARTLGRNVYGDYVVAERASSRVRRAVGLHSVLAGRGPLSLSALMSLYRARAPGDPCSLRDAEISMQTYRHLFVETVESCFAAIGPAGATPNRVAEEAELEEEPSPQKAKVVATEGTISGAIEAELRATGPVRISELIERAPEFLPAGRSVNSIGPVLLTYKDVFARPLPGFYALPNQLPRGEELLRAPPTFIFQEDQVRIYAQARHAGEVWGSFPYWVPEVEYLWADWARRHAEPALLESFLAIADIDAWPAVADKLAWADLKAARGRFHLEYPPNLEPVGRPDLDRVFAACLQIRHHGQLGWVSANRILWRRVTDHTAAGLLAVLVAIGTLEAATQWQRPHRQGPRLEAWLARLEPVWAARGRLEWEDDLGRDLLDAARATELSSLGWVDSSFLQRLVGQGTAQLELPAEIADLDPLEQLLAERQQSRREAELRAAFRGLHGDEEDD